MMSRYEVGYVRPPFKWDGECSRARWADIAYVRQTASGGGGRVRWPGVSQEGLQNVMMHPVLRTGAVDS